MRPKHLYCKKINSKDGNYYRRLASAIGTSMYEMADTLEQQLLDPNRHLDTFEDRFSDIVNFDWNSLDVIGV